MKHVARTYPRDIILSLSRLPNSGAVVKKVVMTFIYTIAAEIFYGSGEGPTERTSGTIFTYVLSLVLSSVICFHFLFHVLWKS